MRAKLKKMAKGLLPATAVRMIKRRRRGSGRALRSISEPPATRQSGSDASTSKPADRLEDRLWLGYETAALKCLSQLASDDGGDPQDRVAARVALARWEMAQARFQVALDHLERAATEFGHPELEMTTLSLAADCLSHLGRTREALARLSPLLDRREADASTVIRVGSTRSAARAAPDYGSGPFVAALNRLYIPARLASVFRPNVNAPVGVGNIVGAAPNHEPRESEALISVIVPACNAMETIGAALDSLLAQSWTNLEVIVVGSGVDETVRVVESYVARDSRVTLLKRPMEDPYSHRNAGIRAAMGTLVTVNGSNEWAHPQKLEMQASALAEDSSLMAVGTHQVRVGSHFIHRPRLGRRPPVSLIDRNKSSIMLRRAVFDQIGVWDEGYAPADEEYTERVEATFGKDAIAWLEPAVPTSIVVDRDPLPDASFGFKEREAECRYRDAFRWWHKSPVFRSSLPYQPGSDSNPFVRLSPPLSESALDTEMTLLALGDLGGDSAELLLDAVKQHDGEIGLIHIPAFDSDSHAISPAFYSLLATGQARLLGGDTVLRCRSLLIGPSLLASPRFDHLPTVTADEAILIVDNVDITRKDAVLDIQDLEAWAGISFQIVSHNESGWVGAPPWM